MPAIRVLLGDMTPMFASLVGSFLAEYDGVELVKTSPGDGLAKTMATKRFDVLLLRTPDVVDHGGVLASLARSAPVGVVAIGDSGETGFAYRIDAMPIPRNSVGRLDLISAIRMAAGHATFGSGVMAGRA